MELTDREKEVLTLIAAGNGTKQIAAQLFLSVRTIDNIRCNLLKKCNAKNIFEVYAKLGVLDITKLDQ